MRTLRVVIITAIAALFAGQHISAQALTYQIFDRYLDTLRQQSAIPGLSAAVVQNGVVLWEDGLGYADLEARVAPTPYTPYVLGDLSQVLASTLLLDRCVDHSYLQTSDRVIRWFPGFADQTSTVKHLLAHATPTGAFAYDPDRYAALTQVIEQCASTPYPQILASQIFDQFAMSTGTAPGQAIASPASPDRRLFDAATLAHYEAVVAQLAVPYQVDGRGRPIRSNVAAQPLDAAHGVISNIDDLRRFDARLFGDDPALDPQTLAGVTNTTALGAGPLPTGDGWFVQPYNDEVLVWQFGMVKNAYSALYLHLKKHNVSLILLANSDGLSSPFRLEQGDVTTSPFAKIFFRVFGL
ncbi:MAG TPA: serine hydrolase domain-containing protein [Vicinamibacterales bacterium]|nr:serine hydrolase domain-containing protein [Vicinamibacterales bacterium]